MNWILSMRGLSLTVLAVSAFALSGCGKSEPAASEGGAESGAGTVAATDVDHSHDGWWCVEHGVPEGECPLCDTSLVSKFKDEGDWCDEHDRPESQCFICSPARFDKFAARYEAKTGEQPPKPTE